MRRYINDCVRCERCVNCGRDNVLAYFCDICDGDTSPDEMYSVDGKEICKDCLIEKTLNETPLINY